MALMNVLAEKGLKPIWDVYRIKIGDMEKYLEEILKKTYGVDNGILIERDIDDKDETKMNVCLLNPEEIDDDIRDRMHNQGMNPDEEQDVQQHLLFLLGGGQDTYIEWGGDYDKNDPYAYVNVYMNARQDIELKLVDLMEEALVSSRDETIVAINKLLKEVRIR